MTERSESPERLFQQLDNSSPTPSISSQVRDMELQLLSKHCRTFWQSGSSYERDPDPAEETVEEPANDWPGADIRSKAKE
jgi:hypothetical protein